MAGQVLNLLHRRHGSRSIRTDALPPAWIENLIEAARLTPSCFNNQPWRFLFLESEEARAKGNEILSPTNRPWAGRAPLLVIGYSRQDDDCKLPDGRLYHQFDLGMAVMNLILAATELGLVARPMAGFSPEKVRELFGLAPEDEPLVMLAIGHLSENEDHLPEKNRGMGQRPRARKPAAEIVRRL